MSNIFLRQALMYATSPQEISGITQLGEEIGVYYEQHDQLIAIYDAGRPDQALAMLEDVDTEVNRVHDQATDLIREGRSSVHDEIAHVGSLVQVSILIGIFSLGIFSMLALMASATTGQVAEPITHLTNAVVAFESNQYQPDMLSGIIERKDEIGRLARALADMGIAAQNRKVNLQARIDQLKLVIAEN